MVKIIIDPDLHGRAVRGGINGKVFECETGVELEVGQEVFIHLASSGISFVEVAGGAGSKEGSADPAPDPLDHDGDGKKGGSKPKKAAAPKKAKK